MRTEGSPEQSLRRVLKAAGYRMRKSRAPISSDNLGGYMIVDMSGSGCETCADRGCGWGAFLPQLLCLEHSPLW